MIYRLTINIMISFAFEFVDLVLKNNFIVYFMRTRCAKFEVISREKVKLKYLIDEALEHKSIEELVLQF